MKQLFAQKLKAGFTTIYLVLFVGLASLTLMFAAFNRAITFQDVQIDSVIKQDAKQREEAFLKALIELVPNATIRSMQDNSRIDSRDNNWVGIFRAALSRVDDVGANNEVIAASIDPNAILSNPVDFDPTNFSRYISPISNHAFSGRTATNVSPGVAVDLGPGFPAPLKYVVTGVFNESTSFLHDNNWPIISNQKVWDTALATRNGGFIDSATISPADHPINNVMTYPDILLSYVDSGSAFIGKRTWWAFELNLSADLDPNSVPDTYVMSIYELPMQLPIDSAALVSVGEHADGTAWSAADINISGPVFAPSIQATGNFDFDRLVAQNDLAFGGYSGNIGTTGETVAISNTDLDRGSREAFKIANSFELPVSSGQDSGRVALISINRGLDFYDFNQAIDHNTTIARQDWDDYSHGAKQCAMRVTVREVNTAQEPTKIDFEYYSGTGRQSITFATADVIDPTNGEQLWPGQSDFNFPFHSTPVSAARSALGIYVERIQGFLADIASYGGPSVANGIDDAETNPRNNSLAIVLDPTVASGINQPTFPRPTGYDTDIELATLILESENLSAYNRGFSIVSPTSLFVGSFLNTIAVSNADLPGDGSVPTPFTPPISIFSPEVRYGFAGVTNEINLTGQVGNISEGNAAVNVLDFKSGNTGAVLTGNAFKANLTQVTHPHQIPPITTKNWLVTIQKL